MALSLNFTSYQSDDGKTLVFHETTGGVSSITGWGSGTNPDLFDAVVATVAIESEDNDIDTPTPIDILGIFPGINYFPWDSDTPQYDFDMGNVEENGVTGTAGDVFPDGIYELTYLVTAPVGTDYTKVKLLFCDYTIRCCIRKMFNALSISDCSCDDEAVCRALKTRTYWKAIHAAVETGDKPRARSLYSLVNKICSDSGYCTGC